MRALFYGTKGDLRIDIQVNREEVNTLFGDAVEDPDAPEKGVQR